MVMLAMAPAKAHAVKVLCAIPTVRAKESFIHVQLDFRYHNLSWCTIPHYRWFTILGDHDTLPDSYCQQNGNNNFFSTSSAAKESCSKDKNCVAFFDSCGGGKRFNLCSAPLIHVVSGCGGAVQKSILYLQHGKYVFGKLITLFLRFFFNNETV